MTINLLHYCVLDCVDAYHVWLRKTEATGKTQRLSLVWNDAQSLRIWWRDTTGQVQRFRRIPLERNSLFVTAQLLDFKVSCHYPNGFGQVGGVKVPGVSISSSPPARSTQRAAWLQSR